MDKDIDEIFNSVTKNFNDRVSQLNAMILEVQDLFPRYRELSKLIVEIYSTPSPDENKITELKENFYRLVKNLNSINKEIYTIIFESDFTNDQSQNND